MRALCLLRDNLAYRKDAFLEGLKEAGCEIAERLPPKIYEDDVLIIWNRYGGNHELARRYEAEGAKVIVCENGHLGKGWLGKSWYAMALNHHAGAGEWRYGGPDRWDALGVALDRWREGGTEYVIFAQRGIGEPGLRSPPNWVEATVVRIAKHAPGIKVRVRAHPGTGAAKVALETDLKHAAGVITWHSAAALAALRMGIPVWYDCPTWIGKAAARPLTDLIAGEPPAMGDDSRLGVFRRMVWAMWTLDEIAAGEPFRHLLGLNERVTA